MIPFLLCMASFFGIKDSIHPYMVVVTVCVLLIIVRRMDGFDGIRLLANLVWFLVAFGLFFGCFLLSFFLTYNKK